MAEENTGVKEFKFLRDFGQGIAAYVDIHQTLGVKVVQEVDPTKLLRYFPLLPDVLHCVNYPDWVYWEANVDSRTS